MCPNPTAPSTGGSLAASEPRAPSRSRAEDPSSGSPVPQGLQAGAAAALIRTKLILAKLNFFRQFADGKGVGRPGVSSSSTSTWTGALAAAAPTMS